MSEWIVRGAGIATLGFAVFHAMLPRMMDWKTDLESLSIGNRKTVRALNIGVTYLLIVMGLVCVLAAPALLSTVLGRGILLGLLGFWALRTAIQAVVYGYEWKPSYAMTAMFVVMTVAYGYALVVR
jgi:hypothetical protein